MTSAEPSGNLPDRIPPSAPWRWRHLDASGADISHRVPTVAGVAAGAGFASQSDAETWIGECWRELLELGVHSVTLVEGDREVYGPMSLRPAGG